MSRDLLRSPSDLKKLSVRVKTRQQNDEIVGFDASGALTVRVRAAPQRGEANRQLVEFLASILNVPKSTIKIVSGAGSVRKVLEIPDEAELPPDLRVK